MGHETSQEITKRMPYEEKLLRIAEQISYKDDQIVNENEIRHIAGSAFAEANWPYDFQKRIEKKDDVFRRMAGRYVDVHEELISLAMFQHDVARMHQLDQNTVIGDYMHLLPNEQRAALARFSDLAVSEIQDRVRVVDRALHNYRMMMIFVGKEFLGRSAYDVTAMVREEMLRRTSDEVIEIADGIIMARVDYWKSSSFSTRKVTDYVVTIGLESMDENLTTGFEIPIGYKSLLRGNATADQDQEFAVKVFNRLSRELDLTPLLQVGFFGSFHIGFAAGEIIIDGRDVVDRAERKGVTVRDFMQEVAMAIREEVLKYREEGKDTK